MFVLYNENLNRFFKHPRVDGVWWSSDPQEAERMLDNIKQVVIESGLTEITTGMKVVEIPESIEQLNENQECTSLRS